MPFSLPPHPLPLSTAATQVREFFIFFVSFPMIASLGITLGWLANHFSSSIIPPGLGMRLLVSSVGHFKSLIKSLF